jgi:hypothetical protein
MAERYHQLIAAEVEVDTRKLDSTAEFFSGLDGEAEGGGGFGPREKISLKRFAEERRAYLLKYTEPKTASAAAGGESKPDSP